MGFKSDIEIAQEATMQPINDIAAKLDIPDEYIENYGKYKAKIDFRYYNDVLKDRPNAKVVLVTAINPTPAGEGKTTTTIGVADALNRLGKKTMVALREPSLGPVFGVKGGASRRPAMRRLYQWKTSISISPATCTPSAQPTTCSQPCLTTTSIRATR